ncbi:MAG: hypothetical protein OHK0053_20660 [Microscillaceae bacterium]
MKKSKFSASLRQAIVSEGQSGQQSIEKLCERHQISPATYYKWRKELEIAQDEDKKRLKALEKENAQLKKMYLEAQLDKEILTEAVALLKKMQAQSKKMP